MWVLEAEGYDFDEVDDEQVTVPLLPILLVVDEFYHLAVEFLEEIPQIQFVLLFHVDLQNVLDSFTEFELLVDDALEVLYYVFEAVQINEALVVEDAKLLDLVHDVVGVWHQAVDGQV